MIHLDENLTTRLFAIQKIYNDLLGLEETNIKQTMMLNIPNLTETKNVNVNKIYKTFKENKEALDIKEDDLYFKSFILSALTEIHYLNKDIKIIISEYQKLASLYWDDKQVKKLTKLINDNIQKELNNV